jgi:glycosyltransferase involved in cell wall biosynthesis
VIKQTLESFTRLQVPAGLEWEVVVVDNNSQDGTSAVLESFTSRLPLRHFLETHQGIAHARNRAALEARGDIILWTDDDVQVKPNWLAGYVEAFAEHPECGFFVGPVELLFEGIASAWLLGGLDSIGGALGQVRVPGDVPVGSCSASVQLQHGRET